MHKIATLGPAGTFSELAVKKYEQLIDNNIEMVFYPNITKVFNSIGGIMDAMDKSGMLSNILNEFSEMGINLTSIISRPTKKELGKYYFFIDIDGHYPANINIKQAIDKIRESNLVKVIGSYFVI